MAHIGRIGEFDETKESFTCYKERLTQFFVANEVKNERKVAVFLSVIGPKTYGILRNLVAP